MRYLGSKARLAKHILPIILGNRSNGQYYIEPFIGAANIFHLVGGPKIGCDTNKYLIAMLNAVKDGWQPPDVLTKERYLHIKNNKHLYPKELVGFVGFGCSFGGKWFGGYATDKKQTNYCGASRRSILKQAPGLKGSTIICSSYDKLDIPPKSLIYCDPPYKNTVKYYANKNMFDYEKFYKWCVNMKGLGHDIYISEYEMPEDIFNCIYRKELRCTVNRKSNGDTRTEKLFVVKS